jgi:biopolymer transport protein ExbB
MILPLANVVVDLFFNGGPIMYPLLLAALVAIAVVGERLVWLIRFCQSNQPEVVDEILSASERHQWEVAEKLASSSSDPVARVLLAGLKNREQGFENSIQVASAKELREVNRCLSILDTLVTLAPLLGLLGTVTGIMGSFNSIGVDEIAVAKVTGGIGEALIATAAGLGIAIFCLIPLNILSSRLASLQAEIEAAATTLQVSLQKKKN